jgi:hypothetical protein
MRSQSNTKKRIPARHRFRTSKPIGFSKDNFSAWRIVTDYCVGAQKLDVSPLHRGETPQPSSHPIQGLDFYW